TFASEDDQVASQFPGKLDAGSAGDGQLGGNVDGKIARQTADQPADANILHDGSVDTCGNHRAQELLGLSNFVFENQSVERNVPFGATTMQELHQPWQIGFGEVVGPHAGVEFFESEIDGI